MHLKQTHITHLLNALYTEDVTSVSVKHPCDDIGELLRLEISDPAETIVRFTQGALTYQDTREEIHTTYSERVYDDLPDAATYVRALIAADLIDIVWRTVVGTDFQFAQTTGPKPTGAEVANWYIDRLVRRAHADPVLSEAFARVTRLEKPPTALLRPQIAWHVLRPTGSDSILGSVV